MTLFATCGLRFRFDSDHPFCPQLCAITCRATVSPEALDLWLPDLKESAQFMVMNVSSNIVST